MLIYYNPNPLKKNADDCVIRAICRITGMTWDKAFDDLCNYAFKIKNMPSSNNTWPLYLRNRGFKRYVIPNTCPDCYTIADFAADHPHGDYIVATGSHVVAVSDGDIYDTWDSSNEIPIYYFRR